MIDRETFVTVCVIIVLLLLGSSLFIRILAPDGIISLTKRKPSAKALIDGYSVCPNCASEMRQWGEIEPIGMKFITYDNGRREIDPIMGVKCGNCGHISLFAPLTESPSWNKKRRNHRVETG